MSDHVATDSTLDHLAVCAECRKVLRGFLDLAAAEPGMGEAELDAAWQRFKARGSAPFQLRRGKSGLLSNCPKCGGVPGPYAEVDPKTGEWCVLCFPGDRIFREARRSVAPSQPTAAPQGSAPPPPPVGRVSTPQA